MTDCKDIYNYSERSSDLWAVRIASLTCKTAWGRSAWTVDYGEIDIRDAYRRLKVKVQLFQIKWGVFTNYDLNLLNLSISITP